MCAPPGAFGAAAPSGPNATLLGCSPCRMSWSRSWTKNCVSSADERSRACAQSQQTDIPTPARTPRAPNARAHASAPLGRTWVGHPEDRAAPPDLVVVPRNREPVSHVQHLVRAEAEVLLQRLEAEGLVPDVHEHVVAAVEGAEGELWRRELLLRGTGRRRREPRVSASGCRAPSALSVPGASEASAAARRGAPCGGATPSLLTRLHSEGELLERLVDDGRLGDDAAGALLADHLHGEHQPLRRGAEDALGGVQRGGHLATTGGGVHNRRSNPAEHVDRGRLCARCADEACEGRGCCDPSARLGVSPREHEIGLPLDRRDKLEPHPLCGQQQREREGRLRRSANASRPAQRGFCAGLRGNGTRRWG